MVQSQRVTDLAAPALADFQPEPWQILQTVDEEVTEGILKNIRLVVRLYYAGRLAESETLTQAELGCGTLVHYKQVRNFVR